MRVELLREIRQDAMGFLATCGISTPPTDRGALLTALKLHCDDLVLPSALRGNPIAKDIRAILDVYDSVVYLDSDLHSRQRDWAILHEIGHHRIEWHREVLYLDPLYHLQPQVKVQMEREANAYAAELAFQGSRFKEMAVARELGLRPAIELAGLFDMSIEATFRRYVEEAEYPCVLIVSEAEQGSQKIRYYVNSPSAQFKILPHQRIPSGTLVDEALRWPSSISQGELELSSEGKTVRHRAESFTNGYRVFTLVW